MFWIEAIYSNNTGMIIVSRHITGKHFIINIIIRDRIAESYAIGYSREIFIGNIAISSASEIMQSFSHNNIVSCVLSLEFKKGFIVGQMSGSVWHTHSVQQNICVTILNAIWRMYFEIVYIVWW